MHKLAIFQEEISEYNVDLYNLLSKKYELTLFYNKIKTNKKFDFKIIFYKKLNIFGINLINFNLLINFFKYDCVILLFNLRWPTLFLPLIFKYFYNTKFILWGIGVSASYNTKFDSNNKLDFLRSFLIRLSNATIFYSNYPINKFSNLGVNKNKLFSANNTIYVNSIYYQPFAKKTSILFIGTLYKEKGIQELLSSYLKAYITNLSIPNLIIIGNGDERIAVEQFIKSNNLLDKIDLYGSIYDDKELSFIFEKCYFTISPNQAGLSVLKSFGFGVPFVTRKNAITGGEIFNIIDGFNGIFYNNEKELTNIILNTIQNQKFYINMGRNAYNYYNDYCTLENMYTQFDNAIKFTIK